MKLFQRKIENFTCEKCGNKVIGNGYTNHCPKCLWSRHVDINPGDRASKCGGLMKPIQVEREGDKYMLIHQCERCGFLRRKKVETEDNFDEVVKISKVSSKE